MKSWNPLLKPQAANRRSGSLDLQERASGTNGAPGRSNPYAKTVSLTKGAWGNDTAPSGTAGVAMTMDDVVVRTTMTLGMVVLGAVLSWVLLPVDEENLNTSYGIAVGAALVAFILALIQVFTPKPVPALILSYAAFEGVFLGVISSAVSTYISPGVVVQTVLGTMAVFAGVLIAYKLRWIRVTRRFYGFVMAAAVGFLILMLANLLFSAFSRGDGLGFRSGWLGLLFGVVGVLLGAAFLALDFRQVEDGINEGAPREQSWLSAFGLTLSLVWIYLEILQLLSLIQGDDWT
ncbi:Bax inhibitor-1/YccA family protein [Streptomyces sp. NBC_00887]|uniref:Bax inhibitor-1/YccA family protein n=1 Tax=Streptomyces sp. NBC_00887 TaxID=2975859 RepID=UPI0038697824|nr:Bax inhibitor-1/YccA family protein [Streptomyces sp. NBC_00887]WSY36221.1 Bax inhibitor-1/YccA family protein [Streptomyces sp. NBC_00887]